MLNGGFFIAALVLISLMNQFGCSFCAYFIKSFGRKLNHGHCDSIYFRIFVPYYLW